MKVSKKYYNLLRHADGGKLFRIDKDNDYLFRCGPFAGIKMQKLNEMYADFTEYLEILFEEVGIVDKKVILEILREIKKPTN